MKLRVYYRMAEGMGKMTLDLNERMTWPLTETQLLDIEEYIAKETGAEIFIMYIVPMR